MTSESPKANPRLPGPAVWWGWGEAEQHEPLSASTAGLLEQVFGIRGEVGPRVRQLPAVPAGRLADPLLDELRAIVGAAHVRVDDATRAQHTRGKSTTDLLKIRAGDLRDAPDAVVTPGDHDEVLRLLAWCTEARVVVVPFGGGTSVVGGLAPDGEGFAGVIALDLQRMDALLALDRTSMTATFGPGARGPAVEAALHAQGLTLGHFPQSFEYASVGGFAATRSSGQASSGYGRFDAMVIALRVATPTGDWRLGRGPANAAGPDLRELVLGSEGAFGVITEVTVRVRELPSERRYEGWQIADFDSGTAVLRTLAQAGALPTIARLSDEVETFAGLANARSTGEQTVEGCYLMLGWEGTSASVAAARSVAEPILRAAGADSVGGDLGDAWLEGRFHGPYLRDAVLDIGGLVETLETTGSWADLPRIYAAVRETAVAALTGTGTPPIVLCHVSHVYPTGASLYFTIACRQAEDPVAQWATTKRAVTDALVDAGGSVTHHHAVGTDHRPWLEREIGAVGVRVLQAVKRELDPAGILNPGVLIAPRGAA